MGQGKSPPTVRWHRRGRGSWRSRQGLWYSVDVVVLVVLVKMAVVDLVRIGMPQFDEILLLLVEEERKIGINEGQWWWWWW